MDNTKTEAFCKLWVKQGENDPSFTEELFLFFLEKQRFHRGHKGSKGQSFGRRQLSCFQ